MSSQPEFNPWNFDFDPLIGIDACLEYQKLVDSLEAKEKLRAVLPSPMSELRRCAAMQKVRTRNEQLMRDYFQIVTPKRAENPLNRWLFEMISMSQQEVTKCLDGDYVSLQHRSQMISADISLLAGVDKQGLTVPRDPLMPWPEAAVYSDVYTHAIATDMPYQPRTSFGRLSDQTHELETYVNAIRQMLASDKEKNVECDAVVREECARMLEKDLDSAQAYLTGFNGSVPRDSPKHPRFRVTELQNSVIAYNYAVHGRKIHEFCAELAKEARGALDEFGCQYAEGERLSGGQLLSYRAQDDEFSDEREILWTDQLADAGDVQTEADGVIIRLHFDENSVTITGEVSNLPEGDVYAQIQARASTELKIAREMFYKLRDLYSLNTPADPELRYFLRCLFCVTHRYHALFGVTGIGHNFHAAAPDSVFTMLREQGDCRLELFASPYNCYFRRFCSAFPDTDVFFGSLGTFKSFTPYSGRFECGPPYTLGVMNDCARCLESHLEQARQLGKNLTFFVFVPEWKNPPSEYHEVLERSHFLSRMLVIRSRRHRYVSGAQFKPGGVTTKDRIWTCPHNTVVYGLTSGSGIEKQLTTRLVYECQSILENWQADVFSAGQARPPRRQFNTRDGY